MVHIYKKGWQVAYLFEDRKNVETTRREFSHEFIAVADLVGAEYYTHPLCGSCAALPVWQESFRQKLEDAGYKVAGI